VFSSPSTSWSLEFYTVKVNKSFHCINSTPLCLGRLSLIIRLTLSPSVFDNLLIRPSVASHDVYFSDLSISFAFFSSLRFASSYLRFSSSSLRFAFFSSRSAFSSSLRFASSYLRFSSSSLRFAFFSSRSAFSSSLRFAFFSSRSASSSSLRFAFFSSRSASSFSRYFVIFSLSTLLTNLFSSLLCSSLMVLLYCMSSKLLALFKPADCARRLFSALDRQKQPASFLLEEKTV
jgi:hypothetical protein